jgi:HEPN domain-containing protein
MHTGTYAPWEHYLKYLRQHEVVNPLSVIEEFFGVDIIEGHQEKLKEWRNYVVTDDCFKDDRHGPGTLFFTSYINVKLVEALYLLMLAYMENRYRRSEVTETQLEEERLTWVYFPDDLPEDMLINPYQYLRKLFKKFMPQHYQDILNEWLHAALSNEANDDTISAADIIQIYEAQLRLYAIAWIIYQRESGRRQLKTKFSKTSDPQVNIDAVDAISTGSKTNTECYDKQENNTTSVFMNLNTNVNYGDHALINRIIDSVKHKIETTLAVIYLGTKKNVPSSVYLLVITSNEEKRQGHELTSTIAETCKPFANVTALVNNIGNVISAVNGGNYFYSNVLLKCTVVIKDTGLQLPVPHPIKRIDFLEKGERYWRHWYGQGRAYLQSAERYILNEEYNLAALSLHQSVQNVLIALIRSILGYRVNVVNLSRMLKITEMFTDKLVSSFELDTLEGLRYYNLLYQAYHDARFSDDFKVEKDEVVYLLAKVKKVVETADSFYVEQKKIIKKAHE